MGCAQNKRMAADGVVAGFTELRDVETTITTELFYYVLKLFCLASIKDLGVGDIVTVKITTVEILTWKGVRTLESGNFKHFKNATSIKDVKDAMEGVAEKFNKLLDYRYEAEYQPDDNNGDGVLTVNLYL